MKKLVVTLLTGFMFGGVASAQQTDETALDYNKWSVEVGTGFHKPVFPTAAGFRTRTISFGHGSVGARYMFNEKAGLKLNFGYHGLQSAPDSKSYESNYYRGSIEGVVNLGNVLNFNTWTQTIGLLGHAGVGVSMLNPTSNEDFASNYEWGNDWMGHAVIGLTPQVKLSDKVSLFGDVSAYGHVRQNYAFDGHRGPDRSGRPGLLFTGSVGLNFYLGKNKEHADWFVAENKLSDLIAANKAKIGQNADAIAKLDGKVDQSMKDANNNGIPDHMEDGVKNLVGDNTEVAPTTSVDVAKELVNKGYVNVFFNTNSATPKDSNSIKLLAEYMKNNSGANVEIIGYADERGGEGHNQSLSTRRAKKVYDILVASGVSSSRMSYVGKGEATNGNRDAYQLNRVVTFKLK